MIPDALLVNKNMLQIDMRSTAKGITAGDAAGAGPASAIESAMTLIDGDCAKWEDGWKLPEVKQEADGRIQVVLHGTFPKDCARTNSINVLDRQDYVERLFRITWKQLGGSLNGADRRRRRRRSTRRCWPSTSRARCRKWSATSTSRPTTRWRAPCS